MGKENTGYIIQLPDGKFKAILEYPPVNGKRTKKTRTCATEAKAKKALVDLNLERNLHIKEQANPKLPFKDAVKVYQERITDKMKVNLLKKRTHHGYMETSKQLLEKFGFYDCYKIKAEDLDEYLDYLLYKKGLAPSSVCKQRIVFDGIFKENKLEKLKTKPIPGSHTRNLESVNPLTIEEQTQLDTYIKEKMIKDRGKKNKKWVIMYIYYFAILTGCREGEIAGLKWSSIREDEGVVVIGNQIVYVPREGLLNQKPKSRSSTGRRLVVSKNVFALLNDLKQVYKDNKYKTSEYVFATRNGTPFAPRNILRQFQETCEEAGLTNHHTFHDLRHTNITTKIGKGIDVKTVSLMAGHADTSITLNTYTHYWVEAAQRAANIFDNEESKLPFE